MFYFFKLLRHADFRNWSRRKKIAGIVTLVLIMALIASNPDMAVFAGVLDVSVLDVFITFIGIQLLLYSDQIWAFGSLAYATVSRRLGKFARRAKVE